MQAHYIVRRPAYDDVLQGLAERPEAAEIILATDQRVAIGFAAFSAIYPGPYLQAGLFPRELHVRDAYRSRGIGQKMLAHLARLARYRGLSRIDWSADANDERLPPLRPQRRWLALFSLADGRAHCRQVRLRRVRTLGGEVEALERHAVPPSKQKSTLRSTLSADQHAG